MNFFFNTRKNTHHIKVAYRYPGVHEVHAENCPWMPPFEALYEIIGEYHCCILALQAAREKYKKKKFNGCFFCCHPCHQLINP